MRLIPKIDGIDTEDAADHVADPVDGEVSYPFGPAKSSNTASSSASKPADSAELVKKGTNSRKNFLKAFKKYGSKNVTKNIKKIIFSKCKIPQKWRKLFLKTGSAALAKSTWKKYGSAFNSFQEFCSEEKIQNPWPLTKNTLICFILWCYKIKNLKACSIRGYFLGLRTISRVMGFAGWLAKRELEKFLIRGITLSEETSDHHPLDPMTFDVVKEIRKSLDKNSWKNSSKNTFWAGVCVGYFGAFRASELFMKDNWHIEYSSDLVWNDVKFNGKNSVEIKI